MILQNKQNFQTEYKNPLKYEKNWFFFCNFYFSNNNDFLTSIQKYNISMMNINIFKSTISSIFTRQLIYPFSNKNITKITRLSTEENLREIVERGNLEIEKSLMENQLKKLKLKNFSMFTHQTLLSNNKDSLVWKIIQDNFLARLTFTSDPNEIRSYSKIAYSLVKSKYSSGDDSSPIVNQNYETKFAVLLPFASHQSFTVIVTSLSRMGPLSHQFTHIVESLYYKRYEEYNIRQKIQINYVLTRNGHKVDQKMKQEIDKMNFKQIVLFLRCYQNCQAITKQILDFALVHLLPRKAQINVLDLSDLCSVYFGAVVREEYKLPPKLQDFLSEVYGRLKRNINDVAFEKIWFHMPEMVNKGYLKIKFVESVIKTMQILGKRKIFSERIWRNIEKTFSKFQNSQIRDKLFKIEKSI